MLGIKKHLQRYLTVSGIYVAVKILIWLHPWIMFADRNFLHIKWDNSGNPPHAVFVYWVIALVAMFIGVGWWSMAVAYAKFKSYIFSS